LGSNSSFIQFMLYLFSNNISQMGLFATDSKRVQSS
jgi:hypothetical protein